MVKLIYNKKIYKVYKNTEGKYINSKKTKVYLKTIKGRYKYVHKGGETRMDVGKVMALPLEEFKKYVKDIKNQILRDTNCKGWKVDGTIKTDIDESDKKKKEYEYKIKTYNQEYIVLPYLVSPSKVTFDKSIYNDTIKTNNLILSNYDKDITLASHIYVKDNKSFNRDLLNSLYCLALVINYYLKKRKDNPISFIFDGNNKSVTLQKGILANFNTNDQNNINYLVNTLIFCLFYGSKNANTAQSNMTSLETLKESEEEAEADADRGKAEEDAEVARLKTQAEEEEARLKAEEEAREKAEAEAREKAEREAREKAEREAREKAEREAREKAEAEAREKAQAEREAREKTEAIIKQDNFKFFQYCPHLIDNNQIAIAIDTNNTVYILNHNHDRLIVQNKFDIKFANNIYIKFASNEFVITYYNKTELHTIIGFYDYNGNKIPKEKILIDNILDICYNNDTLVILYCSNDKYKLYYNQIDYVLSLKDIPNNKKAKLLFIDNTKIRIYILSPFYPYYDIDLNSINSQYSQNLLDKLFVNNDIKSTEVINVQQYAKNIYNDNRYAFRVYNTTKNNKETSEFHILDLKELKEIYNYTITDFKIDIYNIYAYIYNNNLIIKFGIYNKKEEIKILIVNLNTFSIIKEYTYTISKENSYPLEKYNNFSISQNSQYLGYIYTQDPKPYNNFSGSIKFKPLDNLPDTIEELQSGGGKTRIKYKGHSYKIRTGSKGGKYILVKSKKIYLS